MKTLSLLVQKLGRRATSITILFLSASVFWLTDKSGTMFVLEWNSFLNQRKNKVFISYHFLLQILLCQIL